jgi:hypothetical protein
MPERSAFWDASGIVLLCLAQPEANQARRLQRSSPRLVVWWGTLVEATSAFERVCREGTAPSAECDRALSRLGTLSRRWIEVQPVDRVRSLARDLLARHPLRAADALQLGAALVWAGDRPRNRVFVTFDERLGRAADTQGFSVRPPLL